MKNREIKFRAWHRILQRFVQLKSIDFQWNECEYNDEIGEEYHVRCSITDIALLQRTGLHDKNGKEIYEGDITDMGAVRWFSRIGYDGGGALHSGFYFDNDTEGDFVMLDWHSCVNECIILGNIYENPDLL